jgi:6-pyruvoyl-tetrahydropterin synthase related domain
LRRHAVEALAVSAAALLVTLVIAAPVVRSPSELIFGADIVGRHHDPFTVMEQFSRPLTLGLYFQPVTDLTGAAMARVTGAVAAYNWLVLLTFPLSAAAAYLLARHLALPPAAAALAALLFAFSPFHVAHAAYHPHVAQTQWLPLYLLALWRCMDRATLSAMVFLCATAAAVALSNFYGALIAGVITPVAVAAYWMVRCRFAPGAARSLGITIGTLAFLAVAGLAFVWKSAPGVVHDRAAFAFARQELFWYSAKWWSYVVPPVAHPVLGGLARRIWTAAGVNAGLLEQQVSLGWGVVGLGLVAIYAWFRPGDRNAGLAQSRTVNGSIVQSVPILCALAIAALLCSLSPERRIFGVMIERPSALLYAIVPMFRSYARFGVIVQLTAALLAGIGAARLVAATTPLSRTACAALLIVAIAEYAVWPPTLSRDVLPTPAHRWVMRTSGSRAFDCAPETPDASSLPWLTGGRIVLADSSFADCGEPQMAARLRAAGFTHVIVRDTWERQWLREHGDAEGIRLRARFDAADVLSVEPRELVYTQEIDGFWPREHGAEISWRWMGADASWTIVAPTPLPRVTLDVDLSAFHVTRPLSVRLDGGDEHQLDVDPDPRTYRIGPLALSAGSHRLTFHSDAAPTRADEVVGNGDRRALSISVRAWKWSAE